MQPPELLGSIISRFNEFSGDYWPEEPSGDITYRYQHDDLADILGM